MASHNTSRSTNGESTERLRAVVARLGDDDLKRSLGDGWTVGFALAHLAFWDARQVAALQRMAQGEPFPSEDMATNAALEVIADAFDPEVIGQAAVSAAQLARRGRRGAVPRASRRAHRIRQILRH